MTEHGVYHIVLNIDKLIIGDIGAATVLITSGAVLGKVTLV